MEPYMFTGGFRQSPGGLLDRLFNGWGPAMEELRGMARRGETVPGMGESGAWLLENGLPTLTNQIAKTAGVAQQPSQNPADYAHLADAFGGGQLPQGAAPTMAPGMPQAQPRQMPPMQQGITPQSFGGPSPLPQQQQAVPQMAQPTDGPSMRERLDAFAAGPGLISKLTGLATGQRPMSSEKLLMMKAAREYFMAQGMPPGQATAMAQLVALNPKVADEFFKQPTSIEGALAQQMSRGGGSSGNPLDMISKLEAARAGGKEAGTRQATAQMDLPGAIAKANEALRLTAELRRHPGRNQIGWHDPLGSAPLIPGTKGFDAQALLDQVTGGAFLEAFNMLKGGGQITEVEGKKATEAITRMKRALTRAEFDRALSDYEGVIRIGIDRANQQAGQPAPHGFKGNSVWQEVRPGVRIRQVQ